MTDSLRDLVYDAMGRPGDWEKGVIQPSQFELDNYSHWRGVAADVARAITDAGWRKSQAPRVFFAGDTIPGGVCVQHEDGSEYRSKEARILLAGGPYVEVHPMTRKQWQAIVDRARAERKDRAA